MNEAFKAIAPPDGTRMLRVVYITFYLAALPLFLLALFLIGITWMTWDQRGMGVMEGPEPTDAEVLACTSALGLFAVAYTVVFFTSHRITAMRFAWLPFAVQLPPLLWLVILRLYWSSDAVAERLWISLYPVLLLAVLGFGVMASLRLFAGNGNV